MKNLKNFKTFVNEAVNEPLGYVGKKYEVKIIKCSKDTYWYKDLIGETFIVNDDTSRRRENLYAIVPKKYLDQFNIDSNNYPAYNELESSSPIHFITIDDCEILKEL